MAGPGSPRSSLASRSRRGCCSHCAGHTHPPGLARSQCGPDWRCWCPRTWCPSSSSAAWCPLYNELGEGGAESVYAIYSALSAFSDAAFLLGSVLTFSAAPALLSIAWIRSDMPSRWIGWLGIVAGATGLSWLGLISGIELLAIGFAVNALINLVWIAAASMVLTRAPGTGGRGCRTSHRPSARGWPRLGAPRLNFLFRHRIPPGGILCRHSQRTESHARPRRDPEDHRVRGAMVPGLQAFEEVPCGAAGRLPLGRCRPGRRRPAAHSGTTRTAGAPSPRSSFRTAPS